VYTVPVGIIQAITNQQVGLNVITELIIGYALPGRPIAMMMFKTWGYITMTQALQFTSDFKLGHYMKIPHRPMFFCQVAATMLAGTVQLAVQAWLFSNIPDLCSADQKDGFICPSTTVFGTASIIVRSLIYRAAVPYCLHCQLSGVSLARSVSSRTANCTTVSCSSSWQVPFYHLASGSCTRGSALASSSILTSRLFSPARVTCLPQRRSTMYLGSSSASYLTM
jgi:OPT family oligopeptide transporter